MSELCYLPDADDTYEFTATATDVTEDAIVLDGTYFYPVGGGQPADRGSIEWEAGRARVDHVRKDHGDVRHEIGQIEGTLPSRGERVRCRIDDERRRRLSRMHTAQHVVSRVVLDEYGGQTAGNQIHVDRSRIDFEPVSFTPSDLDAIESKANAMIARDPLVIKEHRPRAAVEAQVTEGRALLDLIPESVDPLRVVEIEGYDLCPCGGTHVDRLGAIGDITITGRTSKGENTDRIEFELQD